MIKNTILVGVLLRLPRAAFVVVLAHRRATRVHVMHSVAVARKRIGWWRGSEHFKLLRIRFFEEVERCPTAVCARGVPSRQHDALLVLVLLEEQRLCSFCLRKF